MRKIAWFLIGMICIFNLMACSQLDVVSQDSVRAFGEVLEAFPPAETDGGWQLTAPDGGASFRWASDSFVMTFDAAPFINAGLDVSKLDPALYPQANSDSSSFYLFTGSFDMLNENVKDNPLEQFKADLKYKRDDLSYHTSLDHYSLNMGGGNIFEWAKNLDTNDKDIVFVLDPKPLIEAGVDPDNVEGWVFAKVETMDGEVDKFLKPFNIK